MICPKTCDFKSCTFTILCKSIPRCGTISANLSQFRVPCYKFDVKWKLRFFSKAPCKLQKQYNDLFSSCWPLDECGVSFFERFICESNTIHTKWLKLFGRWGFAQFACFQSSFIHCIVFLYDFMPKFNFIYYTACDLDKWMKVEFSGLFMCDTFK